MVDNYISEMNGYILRMAEIDDIEKYYINYTPLDKELIRLTGCKDKFTKNEICSFVKIYIESNDKYLFFIISTIKSEVFSTPNTSTLIK